MVFKFNLSQMFATVTGFVVVFSILWWLSQEPSSFAEWIVESVGFLYLLPMCVIGYSALCIALNAVVQRKNAYSLVRVIPFSLLPLILGVASAVHRYIEIYYWLASEQQPPSFNSLAYGHSSALLCFLAGFVCFLPAYLFVSIGLLIHSPRAIVSTED